MYELNRLLVHPVAFTISKYYIADLFTRKNLKFKHISDIKLRNIAHIHAMRSITPSISYPSGVLRKLERTAISDIKFCIIADVRQDPIQSTHVLLLSNVATFNMKHLLTRQIAALISRNDCESNFDSVCLPAKHNNLRFFAIL